VAILVECACQIRVSIHTGLDFTNKGAKQPTIAHGKQAARPDNPYGQGLETGASQSGSGGIK